MDLKMSSEQEVAFNMAVYLAKTYDAKIKFVQLEEDRFIYIGNHKLDILLTVCETDKAKCIKIEEINIKKIYRGAGLFTSIMKSIINISDIEKVKLGLWCEKDNKRLFNFYSRLGFKYIETFKDDWLEYN